MEVQEDLSLNDSADSGTEVDISASEIKTGEDQDGFGFKITNVCTLAPSPQEEIDGFEMECEEIEEERHSDVEESDGESESCPTKIIIPQTKDVVGTPIIPKTSTGQTIIYVNPTPAKAQPTTTPSTTSMCTVINSAGVPTLMPQSVIQASLTSTNSSPVVLQRAISAPANRQVVIGQPNQIIKSLPLSSTGVSKNPGKKMSGIKFINVNPQAKEQKVLFVPASSNMNQTTGIRVGGLNTVTLGQPASVVPQNAKICLQTTKACIPTNSPATNLMSIIASKVQASGSATPPVTSTTKFIQIFPPGLGSSVKPQGPQVKTVVGASSTGQPVFTSVPISPLVTSSTRPTTTTIQPLQNIVNGQLQLAFPIQPTGNQAGGKPMQQILLVANPASSNTSTPVNLESSVNRGAPVQIITPVNVKTHPGAAVASTIASAQPVIHSLNSNAFLNNKCIPVIFAPTRGNQVSVTAATTTSTAQKVTFPTTSTSGGKVVGLARHSPLDLHAIPQKLNLDKSSGKVFYVTQGTSGKIAIPIKTEGTKTTPSTRRIIVSPKKSIGKVMVNKETNTEDGSGDDESKDKSVFPKRDDVEAKARKLQRLKRKLAKKKKQEEEVNFQVWEDPVNVRRSSRIREKPQKSYAEKDSDDSLEDEEETDNEDEGLGYEQFLSQLELEMETNRDTPKTDAEKPADAADSCAEVSSVEAKDTKIIEKRIGRKRKEEDPDFSVSNDEAASDSDYKLEEEEENDVEEDELPKWKKRPYKPQKKRVSVKTFPDVNLEEQTDKYSVEDKPVDDAPDRKLYSCKVCDVFTCITPSAMSTHISKHLSGKFSCPFCTYDDVTSSLQVHIAAEHPEKSTYRCTQKECGKGFMTRDLYRKHMSKSHGEYIFSCEFCGKGFTYTRHLRKHLYKCHNGAGIFECSTCGKCFISEFFYDRHVKGNNCQRTPCLCQECGAILISNKMLEEHRRRVHQKERNYMCNICNFTCYRMNQLKDHMNIHTGDYPHKCPLCDFRAAKGYQVTSHMRTHTGKTPFKCDQCNYASRWNIQLRTHRLAHRSPHMVMCEPCGIAYKDERGLNLHKKKRHSESPGAGGDNARDNVKQAEDDSAGTMDNDGEDGDESMTNLTSSPPSVENPQDESSNSSKDSLDNSSEASTEMKEMKADLNPSATDEKSANMNLTTLAEDQHMTPKLETSTKSKPDNGVENDQLLSDIPQFSLKII